MASDGNAKLPTPEEMRDGLLAQLYANRHELKGIALTQAITALAKLTPPAPPPEPEDTAPFSVLDQIGSLPKTESKRLLKGEIARLTADLAAHQAAYDELKGPTNG